MLTEIEIDGLGVYRLPNDWQEYRIRKIADRYNRAIAPYAFGMGMTIQQFKKLAPEDQQRVRRAYLALMSPANVSSTSRSRPLSLEQLERRATGRGR